MKSMIAYYKYADLRVIDLLKSMDDQDFSKKIGNTQKSCRDLVEHIMVYYNLFISPEKSYTSLMEEYSNLSKDELLNLWTEIVTEFVKSVLERESNKKIKMKISKEKFIDVNLDEYVFAYTDHSTYHRGQLIDHYKLATRKEEAISTDYYDFLVKKYEKKI